jgi:DNA-binding MarR family transcriptional regulator
LSKGLLRRFEEAGAVTRTEEPQEGRPPRLVYTLTPAGRELLHDMVADPPPDQAADDYEFLARLGQFALLDVDERLAVLDARDKALRTRMAHFAEMLARAGGERWAAVVTTEPSRRDAAERAWIAGLRALAAEPIARALHATLASVQWTVSRYLLTLGTGLAATAYLARRCAHRGRRLVADLRGQRAVRRLRGVGLEAIAQGVSRARSG